jgi:hypothetical protein
MMERASALGAAVLAAALGAAGCDREPEFSGAETQTTSAQPANQPMTVTGCLRSGVANNTFVLTTTRAGGQAETATYQLTGLDDVSLREHVGQQVEVQGTLRAERQIASRGEMPAERAEGTTGTPRVETTTDAQVNVLDVNSVTSSGNKCPE